jgi:hypothetical protein
MIKMIKWTSNITGNENMTLDSTRRFSTLLDTARRYLTQLTLLNAIRRYSRVDAMIYYLTLLDAFLTLLDAIRRYLTLLNAA